MSDAAEVPMAGQATSPADLRDHIMNPCIAKSEAEWWAARVITDLVAALEPFALLAPGEDSKGVYMGDPLSKWFNVCHLVQARDAINQATTPAHPERGGDEAKRSAPKAPDAAEVLRDFALWLDAPRGEETSEVRSYRHTAYQRLAAMIQAAEQEGRA